MREEGTDGLAHGFTETLPPPVSLLGLPLISRIVAENTCIDEPLRV